MSEHWAHLFRGASADVAQDFRAFFVANFLDGHDDGSVTVNAKTLADEVADLLVQFMEP